MDNRQTSSTHNHRTTVHTTWYKTTFHSPGTKVPHLSRARRCRRCTSRRGARSALQPFHPLPHSRVLFLALPVCVALSVAIARELSGKAIQLYQRVRHFHPDAHRSSVGGGTLRCARSPPPSPPRATVRPCLCHSLVPCPCVPGSSGGASSIARSAQAPRLTSASPVASAGDSTYRGSHPTGVCPVAEPPPGLRP